MLSPNAQQLIHDYLNLPFKGIAGVRCPYFNNARIRQRGQLRVLIGKGTPQDIVDEAQIISIQYHAGLFEKNGECCLHNQHTGEPVTPGDIRKFLVDHGLGIECSGFVTHVLRAHYRETKGVDMLRKLSIAPAKLLLRRLISRLRPVENIDVAVYANDLNTNIIANDKVGWDYAKIQPGDVIVLRETGPRQKFNHIMLVMNANQNKLNYVHARQWMNEGRYGHGVTNGEVEIAAQGKSLTEQTWQEAGQSGDANETCQEIKQAKIVEVRRLKL